MASVNAIDLLLEDHQKVRELLSQLTSTTNRAVKKRGELLQKIKQEILVHAQIEEEIFYPAFRDSDADEAGKLYHEAKEEHRAVSALVLPDLEETDPSSDEFAELKQRSLIEDLLCLREHLALFLFSVMLDHILEHLCSPGELIARRVGLLQIR